MSDEEPKTYHIEGHHDTYHELPDKILMREDGWYCAYKFDGEPIVDYWYVPELKAKRIIVANGATGHCKCGACGGLIGVWDNYCKHCGARLEVER
jgi:hypothetical protein